MISEALRVYLERLRAAGQARGDWNPRAAAAMLMGVLFNDAMGRDCMPERFPYSEREGIKHYVALFLQAIGARHAGPTRGGAGVAGPPPGARDPRQDHSLPPLAEAFVRGVCALMSRLSVPFVATSLAAAVLAAPSIGAAQAVPAAPAPAAAAPAIAPQPSASGVRVLTLDDALTLAEARNECVLIAEAGVRRARGVEAQVHSQRLPQLTGNASYDRTLASEFDGIFDTDSLGEGEENAFADLPFGQPNAYRLGLSFSQLIYAGGRERALEKQARLGRDVATLSVTSAKAQLALDVAQAFYDAALADRLVGIADETLAQASRSFEQTRAKREAGLVSEFELLRAQVDRDTLQSPRVRAGNTRDVAYFRLKQLLDLPLATPLQLAAQLDDPRLAPAAALCHVGWRKPRRRPQPRLRTAVTQADLGVQASEAGRGHRRRAAQAGRRAAVGRRDRELSRRRSRASTTGARTGRSAWACSCRS